MKPGDPAGQLTTRAHLAVGSSAIVSAGMLTIRNKIEHALKAARVKSKESATEAKNALAGAGAALKAVCACRERCISGRLPENLAENLAAVRGMFLERERGGSAVLEPWVRATLCVRDEEGDGETCVQHNGSPNTGAAVDVLVRGLSEEDVAGILQDPRAGPVNRAYARVRVRMHQGVSVVYLDGERTRLPMIIGEGYSGPSCTDEDDAAMYAFVEAFKGALVARVLSDAASAEVRRLSTRLLELPAQQTQLEAALARRELGKSSEGQAILGLFDSFDPLSEEASLSDQILRIGPGTSGT